MTVWRRRIALSAAIAAAWPGVARAVRSEGIDASQFQGNINWTTVHNPVGSGGAGKDFAFIRATRGGTTGSSSSGGLNPVLSARYDDPSFTGFIAGAKNVGMAVAPYHFSRADRYDPNDPFGLSGNLSSPEDEARHFLEIAGPYMKVGYLHPVLDLESGNIATNAAQLSDWVNRFANTITQAKGDGAKPTIYLNSSYARDEVNSSVNHLTLWLARPSPMSDSQNGDPITPAGFTHPYGVWGNGDPKPWTFWQWNIPSVDPNPIIIPGVQNEVDLNVVHGDLAYLNSQKIAGTIWTGATSAVYDPGTNWSGGAEPTSNDDVLFDTTIPGTGATITLTPGENAKALYFANDYTLSGGNLTLSNGRIDVDPGRTATISTPLMGTSGFRKVGPGTLVITADSTISGPRAIAGGVVSIDNQSRLGSAIGTLTIDDGTLRSTNPVHALSFVNANIGLNIGYWGGTIEYTTFNAATIYAGTITGAGGTSVNGGSNTLVKKGLGEFRYQGPGLPNTTFKKLIVKEGLFRLGFAGGVGDERGFGAVPTEPLPDAITLDGGAIGTSFNTATHPNRGMLLGVGGGTIDATAAGILTFTGVISGTHSSTLTAKGSLVLTGANTYVGNTVIGNGSNPTTLTISSTDNLGSPLNEIILNLGTLRTFGAVNLARNVSVNSPTGTIDTFGFDSSVGMLAGGATFNKNSAGRLTATHVRVAALNVNGGTLQIAPSGGTTIGVSKLTGLLTIAGGAKLDLTDNKLVLPGAISAVGSWTGSNYTGVTGQIASGRNGNTLPLWDGGGIITSQSAAANSNFTTLAVARGVEVKPASATATVLWAGHVITGSDTLVMYTYGGDANLDGKINIDDYIRIDQGIAGGLKGWTNGDFNYDGKINIDDYTTVIDQNIGTQGPAFFTSGGAGELSVTAIPEPAGMLSGLVGASLIWRRRKRFR